MTAAISPRVETHRTGKPLTVALWIVQVLLALMFFIAGGHKVAGDPQMVGLFDAIGIGQWFRYVTGILEIGGGVLLLVPRAQAVGAAVLSAVMVGAVTTHLFVLHNAPSMPLVLLVGLAFVLFGRRQQLVALWAGLVERN
ncbi:MAG TPA: DoxX family protein [Polyangiaceae bacterium]|nr:DoxX family protein [Polyangiaceae bacterium]